MLSNNKKFVLLFLLIFFGLRNWLFAQTINKGALSSVGLGLNYSNFLTKRGVIFYPEQQIFPLIGLFLWDDRIELSPEALTVTPYIYKSIIRLRSGFLRLSDGGIFPVNDALRGRLPNRPLSTEVFTRLEVLLPNYFQYRTEIDLRIAHSIQGHIGNFVELASKTKLFDFELRDLPLIEVDFVASVGTGDLAYNKYYYGPDAQAGGGYYDVGITATLPHNIDRYYPGFQFRRFETIGNNRYGEYVRDGKNSGWYFTFSVGIELLNTIRTKKLF